MEEKFLKAKAAIYRRECGSTFVLSILMRYQNRDLKCKIDINFMVFAAPSLVNEARHVFTLRKIIKAVGYSFVHYEGFACINFSSTVIKIRKSRFENILNTWFLSAATKLEFRGLHFVFLRENLIS